MGRRLPVIFVLDVSESMAGTELDSLNTAMQTIMVTLRKNPYALETVWTSVIAYAGKAKTLTPLKELISFVPPDLPMGGGTALGAALDQLMNELKSQVRVGNAEQKGDWKPVCFLITDGRPTDSPEKSIERWNREFRSKASIVAVSIGGQADMGVLRKLTEDIIIFNDAAPDAFDKFAQWISASVSTQSQNAEAGQGDKVTLAKADGDVVREVSESESRSQANFDERYACFVGRCTTKNVPYLLKYVLAPDGRAPKYRFSTGITLDNNYFELTDAAGTGNSISSNNLDMGAPCPHCGNDAGFSVCGCGNLICTNSRQAQFKCGWCGAVGQFGYNETAIDINRGRG